MAKMKKTLWCGFDPLQRQVDSIYLRKTAVINKQQDGTDLVYKYYTKSFYQGFWNPREELSESFPKEVFFCGIYI